MKTTFDLTPDYQAMYKRMMEQLESAADRLVKEPTLANFHAWIAPFSIAFESATKLEQVYELRTQAADLLKKVATRTAAEW